MRLTGIYKFLPVVLLLLIGHQDFAQHVVTSHPLPPGYTTLQTRYRTALEIDSQGNKWVGFGLIGLGKYDGTSWLMYDSLTSGLPSDSVTSIDFDASGNPWIGTRLGAAHFDGSNWVTYNTINSGLPSNLVTAVMVKGSSVWFGTFNGATVFDGTNWFTFTTSNSGLVNDSISKLCPGTGNDIWIGTKNGVSSYNSGTWNSFSSSNSLMINDRVYDMTLDQSGRIWIIPFPLLNTPSLYFIDVGVVHAYMEEYYSETYGEALSRTPVCVSPSGEVTALITAPTMGLLFIEGLNYKVQYFSPTQPIGLLAPLGVNCASYDSQGHLWWLSGFSGANPFNEIETDNYSMPEFFQTIYNTKHLNINDVQALLLNRGHLMYEEYPDGLAYEIPKGSGLTSIYASALWIGGKDPLDSIHVAAEGYYSGFDYFPGPIGGISIPFDSSSCAIFNRMWNIYRWEIESFQHNYSIGAVTNGTYAVPEAILNWPAKGNGLVTDDMAPFVDADSNGLYDPFSGDYPEIKGDQSIFWIFNDSLADHGTTSAPKLGVEVLATAYAYACPGIADSNSVLNTSTFYNYRIRNRSTFDYSAVYLGLWCSVELGDFDDDFIGCDTLLHAGFVYNGDSIDGGIHGYGTSPPMQNTVVLKGPEADPGDGLDNDINGITDEPGERTTMNHLTWYIGDPVPWGWPSAPHEFYNYLQSIWLDSSHMVYGGIGHDPLSTNYTNWLFSGTPYDTGWTEINEGHMPGSRMFIIGSGPVSLPAGGEIALDFAYVFTRDSLNPNGLTTSVARNKADLERIHQWFNSGTFPSCLNYQVGGTEIKNSTGDLRIFPNPARDAVFVDTGIPNLMQRLELFDLTGRLLFSRECSGRCELDVRYLQPGAYLVKSNGEAGFFSGTFICLPD